MPAAHLPMGTFRRIRVMVELGRHHEIESLLHQLARSRIPTILDDVQRLWPDRWVFVRDAVQAHRAGSFTLSIPVLLIHADGITSELFKVSLFSKKRNAREPKTKEGLDRRLKQPTLLGKPVPLSDITQVLLDPLREPSILLADAKEVERQRDSNRGDQSLNRHGVLHGSDLKYPSEANSLRALLLIAYLIEVHELLHRHEERVRETGQIIKDLLADSPGSQ